uniref:Glycosyltransferase 61 catalytic domain-containing protein n=1 Tax=Timspurckia oligopyrenoides TaxID=708627 RepID=A0A7S0ZEJ9_9RHOD|mmetsp:Transcript_2227/g.3933  ORF Transcript_2227/g.3933 Transcript_2227/m.3933 type:complete len:613 (+) Transcript_2227:85-1923(+)
MGREERGKRKIGVIPTTSGGSSYRRSGRTRKPDPYTEQDAGTPKRNGFSRSIRIFSKRIFLGVILTCVLLLCTHFILPSKTDSNLDTQTNIKKEDHSDDHQVVVPDERINAEPSHNLQNNIQRTSVPRGTLRDAFNVQLEAKDADLLPVLFNINPKAKNPKRHVFLMGSKSHRHEIFLQMVSPQNSTSIAIADYPPACSGTMSAVKTLHIDERKFEGFCMRESSYPSPPQIVPVHEFSRLYVENTESLPRKIPGTSVIIFFEMSAANIAHYSGRVFYLHHILENLETYGLKESEPLNIFLITEFHTMKRFKHAERYGNYHISLLEIVLHPLKPLLDVVSDDVWRESSERQNDRVAMILSGLHMLNEKDSVVFEKAVVLGFLKACFFISDTEYSSSNPFFVAKGGLDPPNITRDSISFRRKLDSLLQIPLESDLTWKVEPRLILVDRKSQHRGFVEETRNALSNLLREKCEENGYHFEIVHFEELSALDQIKLARHSAILIGVHGANLVNAIYMPPLAVLIEIFPHRFHHDMYVEGGKASLKYFSFNVSQGEEYPHLAELGISTEDCILHHEDCKVFYRDSSIRLSENDLSDFSVTVDRAFDHLYLVAGSVKQ